ncbi:MAG TPA: peptidoglycan recognition family protein [Pirellulales bacterium]|nr:peptidoglycan recognition family protein [Pirellulales bacterium]
MATWIEADHTLPVTYKTPQAPMHGPVLGAVLHTTNSPKLRTLEDFQSAWQAAQRQSAHFAIDRDGKVGQYRALEEVAWHIGGLSTRYIGIEHIAEWKEALTDDQINASAALLANLAGILNFPLAAINRPGEWGIGFHRQFNATYCGEGVFCTSGASPTSLDTFDQIIDAAQNLGLSC